MNAKQAKAIVFVCGLLLFAAAVINLQAADYLAALAWAAVVALAAVLYAGATDDKADVKRAYKQGKDDAADEVIDIVKQAMDLLRIDPKQQAAIAKAMQVVLACKASDLPLPDRIDVKVKTDQPEAEDTAATDHPAPFTADEQEDTIMDCAACIIDHAPDYDEEQVYEREVAFEHCGKEYNARLSVELTRDLTDTPDTSEQGAVTAE